MPLTAVRHVRKMRGGAQSHLIQANDGNFYVVKFRNNPQHRRVLINEAIAQPLLEFLELPAPAIREIEVTREFLDTNPDVCIQFGDRRLPVEAGWQFGSRYPGDPERVVIYDFLPDALLRSVVNLRDFLGVLVFDKWTSNADGRQSVFWRTRVTEWAPERTVVGDAFVALMIDQGFLFNGPHWEFADAPLQGLYHRPVVYESVRSLDDFQPWLDRVTYCPAEELDRALRRVPPQWKNGDAESLERMLEQLYTRRSNVAALITAVRSARPAMFPKWS